MNPECAVKAEALSRDLSDVRADLAALKLRLPLMRGQAREYGVLETPWPPEVPASRREAGLRQLLNEIPGSRLARLDCEEYPCLYALEVEAEAGDPEATRRVWALLHDDGVGCPVRTSSQATLPDAADVERTYYISPCGQLTDSPDQIKRERERLRLFIEQFAESR